MSSQHPNARRKIPPPADGNDDYARFVQSLAVEDPMLMASNILLGDDEEDFELTDLEEESEDEEDLEEDNDESPENTNQEPAPLFGDFQMDFYQELEAELGSLLEEDLEAAVSTLLAGTNKKNPSPTTTLPSTPDKTTTIHTSSSNEASPTTPLGTAARASSSSVVVTSTQVQQLQKLLKGHYQLLLQNSVLAVRAARKHYEEDSCEKFHGGETPEDFTEILDASVSMLQDLDQVCERCGDASVQCEHCEWKANGGRVVNGHASASEHCCSVQRDVIGIIVLLTQFTHSQLSLYNYRIARTLFAITFRKTLDCLPVLLDLPFKLFKNPRQHNLSLKCLAWRG
jgi:hypothetical protein